jgi:polar amino acid transport system substrate-binding protein
MIGCVISVKAEETIRVVTESWRPYNYEENGIAKGPSSELVRKVLDKAGIQYKIRVYPWARAYKIALEEKNVLIYTIARTPERESLFKWVRPIAEPDNTYLYKLSNRKDIIINTLDDAKKYQIGIIKESMYHQFLIKKGFTDNLQIVPQQQQNYKKLLINRIDLLAQGERNLQEELKKKHYKDANIQIEKAFMLFQYPYYMAFSKSTSDEVVEKVRTAFDQLEKEGALQFAFH